MFDDPDAFWRQTPGSFAVAMRGASRRARMAAQRDIALAHTIAAMSRAKKLDTLDRYLPVEARGGGRVSMLEKMRDLAAATAHLG